MTGMKRESTGKTISSCRGWRLRCGAALTLLASLVLLSVLSCAGPQVQSGDRGYRPSAVTEHTLGNGLKVLVVEDHKSPLATFQVWYRAGSLLEKEGKTGLSHFLEHMMFKGTPRFGAKQFSKIVQKNGGVDNAFTTKDYTMYYETLAADRLSLAMDLESDRMHNLTLDPEEVKSEKKVVMEERRMRYEDDPQNLLLENVTAAAIDKHPYHNPVIGWMKDIESFDRNDLASYYQTHYAPNNAVIVVAGDVATEKVIEGVEKYFAAIPAKSAPDRLGIPQEPPQTGQKRVSLRKQAKLPFVLIAFHVPSIPEKDAYALEILTGILSGKSGRLYQDLVKGTGPALNIFSYFSAMNKDPYLYYIGGTAKQGLEAGELESALFKEIEKLQAEPPLEREVQKARNQAEASFIMGQDSIFFQGEILGMYEMTGGWRLKDTYLDEVKKVTPAEVQEVAKKYFTKENSTVGILIPEE